MNRQLSRAAIEGRRRWVVAAFILVVTFVASEVPRARSQAFEVVIGANLTPAEITVPVGASVTWRNEDGARHRVRSQSGPDEFDSGNLEAGETFTHSFGVAGTYEYVDARNPNLPQYAGRVIVSNDAPASGSPNAGGAAAPAPNTATVSMAGRRFSPATVTIAVGGTVTFNNNDNEDHTATARDRSFDSGTLGGGRQFQHTFDTAGRYAFICAFHSDMTGEVVVTDASGAAPTPSPSPAPVAATSTTPGSSSTSTPGGAVAARIVDFDFAPQTVSIQAGQSITWTNDGVAPHTVTATDGSFDSGIMDGGQTYTRTFAAPGRFPFLCSVHPNMVGEVVVSGANGAPPPAAAIAPSRPASSTGASPSSSSSSSQSTSADLGASILDFEFAPDLVTIEAGDTVHWTNDGVAPHTVTALDGSFDTGLIEGGGSAALTFTEVGEFPFYCTLHPNMEGTIVVRSAGTAAGELSASDVAGSADSSTIAGPEAVSTFVAGDEASVSTSTGGDGLNVALLTVLLLAVGAAGAAFGFVARGLEAR